MVAAAPDLELHRVALTGHCYRMLGSPADADDAVQEAMIRAWRSLDRFDGRSSLRTWLYRIATNVCLDQLASRERRHLSTDSPPGTTESPLIPLERNHWVEPVHDAKAIPADTDPAEQALLRESIRLAFVAALQHLPPKQRAALLLVEVLGWSATEVADCLDTTTASVNSALQRARATLAERNVRAAGPLSPQQKKLLEQYVDAFLRYDVEELTTLLHRDATLSMPPFSLWLQGPDNIAHWLTGRGAACRGSKLVPTQACGQPAWAQYKPESDGSWHAWGLMLLDVRGDRVGGWITFLDTEHLCPHFGLPVHLPPDR